MPTASGTTYRAGNPTYNKLLTKRDTSARHRTYTNYSSSSYGSGYSAPSPSYPSRVSEKTSYLLNSNNRDLSRDFSHKLDLNNNNIPRSKYPSTDSYRAGKTDYISTSSSRVIGSHYTAKPFTTTGQHYSTSSRSSSVDSGYDLTRTRRSTLASQNYNDSCSSHGSDTSLKVCFSSLSLCIGIVALSGAFLYFLLLCGLYY